MLIVTKDGDFHCTVGDQVFLRPNLESDLKLRGVDSCSVFSGLAKALPQIKAATKSRVTLPAPEVLRQIENEEQLSHRSFTEGLVNFQDWSKSSLGDAVASSAFNFENIKKLQQSIQDATKGVDFSTNKVHQSILTATKSLPFEQLNKSILAATNSFEGISKLQDSIRKATQGIGFPGINKLQESIRGVAKATNPKGMNARTELIFPDTKETGLPEREKEPRKK